MSEQKNRSVIDTINNCNIRNRALSIVTYDFSTFFTNIPGIKPENVMRKPTNQFLILKVMKNNLFLRQGLVQQGLTVKIGLK